MFPGHFEEAESFLELEHHGQHEERRLQRREEDVSAVRVGLLHRAHAHLSGLARLLLHSKIQVLASVTYSGGGSNGGSFHNGSEGYGFKSHWDAGYFYSLSFENSAKECYGMVKHYC